MKIADIDKNATLITDSQDVRSILIDLGIDDDYGGLFIGGAKVYGFDGTVPYKCKKVYYIGDIA